MIIPSIRSDSYGSGEYLAKRGTRAHEGIDFHCYQPGLSWFSDVVGVVDRLGFPYSRHSSKAEYRLIEIKIDALTKVKYMYIDPVVKPGDFIKRGQLLGKVQNLSKRYPADDKHPTPMSDHVHFEVIIEGVHVDPLSWLNGRGWL